MSAMIAMEAMVAGWSKPVSAALNLSLASGEIVGLVGPNGVGKSTILAAIVGKARVFSGRLEKTHALRIAWQTQDVPPVMNVPLSGRDLLVLTGAGTAGMPEWLADKLDVRLDKLSGGQRHYLALWAVVQSLADAFLLDEPTNNLDAAGVLHLSEVLRQRAAAGAAVLVVSHDDSFVDEVCHRVVHLEA